MKKAIGRRVVCAAICKHPQGRIITGARHMDLIMIEQIDQSGGREFWVNTQQGFIDQKGVFMNRVEAWKVAEAAGQILRRVGGDMADGGTLYSENLY